MRLLIVIAAILATAPVYAAPSPSITTLDGGHFSFSDHTGKWMLINYWATWCAPCLAEMPILSDIAKARPQLVVIGLTSEAITPDALRAFLTKRPVSYAIAIINKANSPQKYRGSWLGIEARPLTYLIRPDGSVAKRFLGEITVPELEKIIDQR